MPPRPVPPVGRQVCACHDVSETRIVEALAHFEGDADARLIAVQRLLRCGTECGSCLPAVRTLVRRHLETVHA